MKLKFRSYNKATGLMKGWDYISKVKNLHKLMTLNHVEVMQFTGFNDKNGTEIFDGDILSDWTKIYEGLLQFKMQVFWNQPTGSWHLDNSLKQDKTSSVELWLELNDFKYEITGNIYEAN